MDLKQHVLDGFARSFGTGEMPRLFFSPGRVNLIGEHIDYNGGLVFPCAITLGTYGAFRKRSDEKVKLYTGNFNSIVEFSLEELEYDQKHGWGNYPKAVISLLQERKPLGGFEMYIHGNLPSGAGLSSSACLNTLFAFALDTVFEVGLTAVERALLCQKAEHINGVNCGIMDPFACGLGKKDHTILLNCATLEYQLVPLQLGDYRIVLANTNYRRGLADSKYNERRAECEEALADLQAVISIKELCDLSAEEFEKHKHAIKEELPKKRAEHAVYENYRTKDAARALTEGNLDEMGKAMVASHLSLRELYDVVGDALDALFIPSYEYGVSNPGTVHGTRMTGAGFGGCTVSIVHKGAVEDFIKVVGEKYAAQTGLTADFYVAEVADGAKELKV